MAEGTIKWFNANKGYGFIERERQDDLFIHIKQWRGAPERVPQEGDRVTFEEGTGPKGRPEAQNVRPAGAEMEEPTPPPRVSIQDENRFLNPYNFVRYPDKPRPQGHVLGDCSPPPHDRYVGLTGRIACTVKAVTPLFVSDGHAIQVERVKDKEGREKDHSTYRFFQYEGKPAVPASSLRGMLRSTFEAVTNSCLAILDDTKLSFHYETRKAPWLVPARVEKGNGEWQLRLLTGSTRLQIMPSDPHEYRRGPRGTQYAAWLHRYWPMKPSGTLQKDPPPNQRVRGFQNRRRKGSEVKLNGLSYRDECYALLEEVTHPFPSIRFWDVVAVSQDRAELEQQMQSSQRIEQGWLCITNQNIEPKHSERFFFRSKNNRIGPQVIDLPQPVQDDYEALIKDYQSRHKESVRKRPKPDKPISEKDAGFSRFIYQREARKLQDGDLVYAMLSGTVNAPRVDFMVPVSVPRVAYDFSIGDLLPFPHLHRCDNYQALCPACRVFGWVRSEPPDDYVIKLVVDRTAHQYRGDVDRVVFVRSEKEPSKKDYGEAHPLVNLAVADLRKRLGVSRNQVVAQIVQAVRFPDTGLGIPEPGKIYRPVVTPGYVIRLVVNDTVYEYHGSNNRFERIACAGRVRLTHAKVKQEIRYEEDITLSILSTPKPTTTQFYLLDRNGKPSPTATYNTKGSRLRGRKFYRHQGQANPAEYERVTKDDQNRTVRGALKPGSTFTFDLEFENLALLELGALLYALKLEEGEGMVHRLGYAKPLGFGSVKITVDKVERVNWGTRLKSLDEKAGWSEVKPKTCQSWVKKFKDTMTSLYGDTFDTKVVADLKALLSAPPTLPIHYPRPTEPFDPDHPQYEWFVGNKRRVERIGRGDLPDPEALSLASEDTAGLPLIDKQGHTPV